MGAKFINFSWKGKNDFKKKRKIFNLIYNEFIY